MRQALFKHTERVNEVTVHTDGGSRGNPGPAAIGVVIEYGGGKKEDGESIDTATNNVAAYSAVAFALKKVKQLIGKEKCGKTKVTVFADSELLVKQLTGVYKIEEPHLQPLWIAIWNLRLDFGEVRFKHVYREANKGADRMVNRALDGRI